MKSLLSLGISLLTSVAPYSVDFSSAPSEKAANRSTNSEVTECNAEAMAPCPNGRAVICMYDPNTGAPLYRDHVAS